MSGSWDPAIFPRLIDYQVTSDKTRQYNCIAWAVEATDAKWWPDPLGIGKWPDDLPRAETIEAFVHMFGLFGYVQCADGLLEEGFAKVAVYAIRQFDGSLLPTHAARQLPSGKWTSKIGDFEDIEHASVGSLNSDDYGEPVCYLRRDERQ
jgi:hypothetical protein